MILSAIFVVLFAAIIVGGILANNVYKRTINDYFGLRGYETHTVETDPDKDLEYFHSDYVKKNADGSVMRVTENGYTHDVYDDDALWEADVKKAEEVQKEGTVILWNTDSEGNRGLPLSSGNNISLFSHSSVDYCYSATSTSSGKALTDGADNLKQAFEKSGFNVNNTLWDFYDSGAGSSYKRSAFSSINEVPWNKYTSAVTTSFADFGDAAVIILSRQCGENGATDATQKYADTDSGDYFDLSPEEEDMFSRIIGYKKQNVFKKVVLLMNTPTGFNFATLEDYRNDIDSCVWIGQGGYSGLNAVADILAGKIIPSGHLVDTYTYNAQSAPAAVNSVFSSYSNIRSMNLKNLNFQGTYLVYAENIYVGYKYYETRYEDAVTGNGNASSATGAVNSSDGWVYGDEVAYPFGYGESYTTFEYSNYSVTETDDGYEVSLTVTNTGNEAGADAVQIYVQKPYTEHDKKYGIEQAAVNLCGYAKTKELAANEHEDIKITVEKDAFRTYDDAYYNTYIFEAGDYYITAASDAHAAVNNILAAKGYTPSNTSGVMDAEGDTSLVWKYENARDDYEIFSRSANGTEITNRFESTDWNKYKYNSGDTFEYLSRSDWEGTYPTALSFKLTTEMVDELGGTNDNDEYNHEVKDVDPMPTYGADNGLVLINMKGLEYDNEAWDDLLDQMTLLEQSTLCATAYHGTTVVDSIVKPEDVTLDGPMGIRQYFKNNKELHTMSFPSNALLAATYNDRLAYEVAQLMAEDMIHCDVDSMYGTAPNLHRTLYGGRAFEYYSEDSFISGAMCRWQTQGIQDKGCYVVIKHLALNDQETNRHGVGIWANEQSIRELYLEAFRPAVEDAHAKGVMSSFTRFGTVWSGAYDGLNNKVLRDEWGFDGYVISDCSWREYMGIIDGLMGGNDCILMELSPDSYVPYAENNGTVAQALREAVHRILYVTVNTTAVNGVNSDTEIVEIVNWWQYGILAIQIVLGVIAGGCIVMTVLSFILKKRSDKKSEINQ